MGVLHLIFEEKGTFIPFRPAIEFYVSLIFEVKKASSNTLLIALMPDLMTKIAFKESDGSVTQFGNRAENFSQLL